jgi:hypothetical protein
VVSFTPRPLYCRGKSPQCPLYRRLGGPQSRSGRHGEVKILATTATRTPTPWSSSPSACSLTAEGNRYTDRQTDGRITMWGSHWYRNLQIHDIRKKFSLSDCTPMGCDNVYVVFSFLAGHLKTFSVGWSMSNCKRFDTDTIELKSRHFRGETGKLWTYQDVPTKIRTDDLQNTCLEVRR